MINFAVDELPFGNNPSPPKLLICIVPIGIHESSSVSMRSRSWIGYPSAARTTAVLDNEEKDCATLAVEWISAQLGVSPHSQVAKALD